MPVLKEGGTGWPCRVVVWFDRQFLEDGDAYRQKILEFSGWKRSDLRRRVVGDLKQLSDQSWKRSGPFLETLVREKKIDQLERHWIINGFSCRVRDPGALSDLITVSGLGRVFACVDELPVRAVQGQPRFYPAAEAHPGGRYGA